MLKDNFTPIQQKQNDVLVLRNLLRFRLAVLSIVILVSLFIHFTQAEFSNIGIASVILTAAFIITLAQLYHFRHERYSPARSQLFFNIVFDFIWVSLFVIFVGKSSNPFIYYYLALVAFSASLFKAPVAWSFCILSILIYSGLLISDISLHFHHFTSDFQLHLMGMWLNFVGSTLLTCFFVNKLANQLRTRQDALTEARENTLKKEQIVGLGTIAATTMHELATPLSTITVILEDMVENDAFSEFKDDSTLVLQQIQRCKTTMGRLSSSISDDEGANESAGELYNRAIEYCSLHHPHLTLAFKIEPEAETLNLKHSVLLDHAITNLINNAVEASSGVVAVEFKAESEKLIIQISNDMTSDRAFTLENWGQPQASPKELGLGIGSFLANSTIEKYGGVVSISNEEVTSHTNSSNTKNSETVRVLVEIKLPTIQ